MKKARTLTTALATITALAASAFAQGSLTPPGAPAPTMKTLDQVEPRIDLATVPGDANSHHVISQPGSYYLSANMAVTKSSDGIYINVPGVMIDLNGFEISRVSGIYGIFIGSAGEGATVRNGSITGFDYGINSTSLAVGGLFEKLSVSACATCGIFSGALSSQIIDCRAFNNQGVGIYAYESSTLSGCTAHNNEGSGIYVLSGSILIGCTANNNLGNYGIYALGSTLSGCSANKNQDTGIYTGMGSTLIGCTATDNQGKGIVVHYGSTLSGCTARNNQDTGIHASGSSSLSGCIAHNNQGNGIYAFYGSSLSGCTATDNQGTGIYALDGSSLSDCTAYSNQGNYGIYAAAGSSLSGCTANNNEGTGSSSYGIYVSSRSTVIGCSAYNNSNTNSQGISSQGVGIYAGNGSTVKDCTASENEGDGIRIPGDCVVSGNTCDGNGNNGDGAGIHSTSTDNRIDGNNVTDTDRGIDVDTYGSLIIRNSASGNTTDYDIAANNDVGTIQTTPVGAGAWDDFSF